MAGPFWHPPLPLIIFFNFFFAPLFLNELEMCPRSYGALSSLCTPCLDGSGSHQNFNQMDKKHFSTTSIISVCFRIKEIRSGDTILYKPESANKPCLVSPWMLFPGIELDPLLCKVTILMKQEIHHVKQNRIQFSANGKDVEPALEKVNLSMIDGKSS